MQPPERSDGASDQAAVVSGQARSLCDALLARAQQRPHLNQAAHHAVDMVKAESARVNGQLIDDFGAMLAGDCIYLNDFVCAAADLNVFHQMKSELMTHAGEDRGGLIDWSKHKIYENPTAVSETFNGVVLFLDKYFDVEIYATRLNCYGDGTQWKPYHHDSHAYGGRKEREDFTVGLSLGATRSLSFLHEQSGTKFDFPQANGDCFAFTSEVNNRFKHGVPRGSAGASERISVIAWGRRRTVNERNGGKALDRIGRDVTSVDDAVACAHDLVAQLNVRPAPAAAKTGDDAAAAAAAKKRKAKKRLQ
jgi:hypothetical protein